MRLVVRVAASITLVVVLSASGGCGSSSRSAAPTPSDTPSTPAASSTTPTPTPTPTPSLSPSTSATPTPSPTVTPTAAVVTTDYTKQGGVKIFKVSQLSRLKGPPEGLADYFRQQMSKGDTGFVVDRTRSDGWATGGVVGIVDGHEAGGAAAIWHRAGTTWKQAWAGQDVPMCADLHKLRVPANMVIPPRCFADPAASAPVTYRG